MKFLKINKLKINSYGKLKEKEINLENGINLIYGENEAGKSTLIKFIINSFYGIHRFLNARQKRDLQVRHPIPPPGRRYHLHPVRSGD